MFISYIHISNVLMFIIMLNKMYCLKQIAAMELMAECYQRGLYSWGVVFGHSLISNGHSLSMF